MNMGTLSPNPWDLSLSGKNGCLDSASLNLGRPPLARPGISAARRAMLAVSIPAAESALGSHPCVALSTAQVWVSICPFDFSWEARAHRRSRRTGYK